MKPLEILKLYENEYPTLMLDISAAKKFEQRNDLVHAGEKYRFIAKKLLKLKLFSFSIDYFMKASEVFSNCGNYLKVIGSELSIYQIHRISNNLPAMASTYEKIATVFKSHLLNPLTAGNYFLMSAKHHEENMNYLSAFTKAKYACECFNETNNNKLKRDSHSLAFRMALQSKYYERAGIYARKLLELVPKDYSVHYLSICMKGYKTLQNTDLTKETLMFVNEIIIAHYEQNMPQERILKYLEDAQKLFIKEHKEINEFYNQKILFELEDYLPRKIKYSIEFKSYAQNLGLINVADKFYLQEKELARQQSKSSNYFAYVNYTVWKYSCNYGTNLMRWLITSFLIIIIFGALYSQYNIKTSTESINHFFQVVKPSINITGVDNWFSPYYYSVVTFATLGYGDITPSDLAGQVFSVIEVLIGYIMLGGLLSVFSKKIIR